jgi:hypothetical protein
LRLVKFRNDFFAFGWLDKEVVSTHVTKLLTLWNELNSGLVATKVHALPNLLFICKVMSILPKSFESFKSSWMIIEKYKDKPQDELTSKLCMLEKNFVTSPIQETVIENLTQDASVARQNWKPNSKKNNTCNYCKRKDTA